jgi:hypothetical protein
MIGSPSSTRVSFLELSTPTQPRDRDGRTATPSSDGRGECTVGLF